MKTINKTSLLLALIILAIAFSIISMIAAPAEIRYSWHGLNPWNTVQAVPLMFKRFLKMNDMYWHLGIEWDTIINLGRLFKSGIILDFAGRLDKCANYLEQTAEDFNRVERELSNI